MQSVLLTRKNARVGWKIPFSSHELEGIFTAMLQAAGRADGQLELAILDDAEMAALHKANLGCSGPTNILSFPAEAGASFFPRAAKEFPQSRLLGWLALSVDTLHRECFLYGQPLEEHCIRLLAHGLAHLLGHDHGRAMRALCLRLETAALEASG